MCDPLHLALVGHCCHYIAAQRFMGHTLSVRAMHRKNGRALHCKNKDQAPWHFETRRQCKRNDEYSCVTANNHGDIAPARQTRKVVRNPLLPPHASTLRRVPATQAAAAAAVLLSAQATPVHAVRSVDRLCVTGFCTARPLRTHHPCQPQLRLPAARPERHSAPKCACHYTAQPYDTVVPCQRMRSGLWIADQQMLHWCRCGAHCKRGVPQCCSGLGVAALDHKPAPFVFVAHELCFL